MVGLLDSFPNNIITMAKTKKMCTYLIHVYAFVKVCFSYNIESKPRIIRKKYLPCAPVPQMREHTSGTLALFLQR